MNKHLIAIVLLLGLMHGEVGAKDREMIELVVLSENRVLVRTITN